MEQATNFKSPQAIVILIMIVVIIIIIFIGITMLKKTASGQMLEDRQSNNDDIYVSLSRAMKKGSWNFRRAVDNIKWGCKNKCRPIAIGLGYTNNELTKMTNKCASKCIIATQRIADKIAAESDYNTNYNS